MDKKKQDWLSKLKEQPCARCGYTEERNDRDPANRLSSDAQPNIFPYAGPSAVFDRANILTPESPESAMEEGLLIGSDFGSGYSSVERAEPVLKSPEEVVVGKGKKKAKSASSQAGSSKTSASASYERLE